MLSFLGYLSVEF